MSDTPYGIRWSRPTDWTSTDTDATNSIKKAGIEFQQVLSLYCHEPRFLDIAITHLDTCIAMATHGIAVKKSTDAYQNAKQVDAYLQVKE